MNRLARLLGILAGIGVVIWAMRDRFISLTVPKEPEPPAFRTASQPAATTSAERKSPAPAESSGPDDLTEVNGIGPVFAGRLSEAGITTFSALAATGEDRLAEILGSRLSKLETILEDARRLAGS